MFTPDAGSAGQTNSISATKTAQQVLATQTSNLFADQQPQNDAPATSAAPDANRFAADHSNPDQISPSPTSSQSSPSTLYSTQTTTSGSDYTSSESPPETPTSGSARGQLLAIAGSTGGDGESEPKVQEVGLDSNSAADEWRPISSQATPPLARQMKTVFRPNQQQVAAQMATFQTMSPLELATPVASLSTTKAPEAAAAATSNAPISRPMAVNPRAKRPQLGFNGQSIRGGKLDRANRLRTQDGATSSSSQSPHGSINGIRRPGLSTTPAPPSTTSVSSQQPPATVDGILGSSDQLAGRLPGSGPNRKRGFKRPPLVPSSQPLPPSTQASQQTLQAKQENSPKSIQETGSVDPIASVASESKPDSQANLDAQEQPAEAAASIQSVPTVATAGAPPVVGSDEVLGSLPDSLIGDPLTKPMSRSGEQRPGSKSQGNLLVPSSEAKSLSGQLVAQSNDPFNLDALFQGDSSDGSQNQQSSSSPTSQQTSAGDHRPNSEESQHRPSHIGATGGNLHPKSHNSSTHNPHHPITNPKGKHSNDKLTGWMDQHMQQKFVPRASQQHAEPGGRLSQQLSASLSALEPSFSSNIPSKLQAASQQVTPSGVLPTSGVSTEVPAKVDSSTQQEEHQMDGNANSTINVSNNQEEPIQLQTITRTYSTVMTSTKTRMVPLQVKSTTAIYTITEQYVITKMLTAYQTMPMGEFILPEPLSTRAPFEMFNEKPIGSESKDKDAAQQVAAAAAAPAISASSEQQQEQPISLEPKSPNDWLHDFTNSNNNNLLGSNTPLNNNQDAQQNLAALLEQQAQQANLASPFGGLGEPLDGLASQLDPATLLADGSINIPDLNNPLVLAAAIQNPQLAAVILAAQQLRLQQQRNKQLGLPTNQQVSANNNNQQVPQANQVIQLQPSYSTTFSTTIRPSTYTLRDTMFTTRLVSFKDGRTVRTRTVSEPGSVIEQVLTTMATEVTPITITIRPTGLLTVPIGGQLATAAPGAQSTINNALIATQLASLLARRQQQVQPSLAGANPSLLAPSGAATPQQLLALQQLLRQQQQQPGASPTAAKQFQPNIQQLLQGMQSPQAQQATNSIQQSEQNQRQASNQSPATAESQSKPEVGRANNNPNEQQQFTPPLPLQPTQLISQPSGPITTVFTNLQVRTYTVHNAFKTIYRTITSTQLVTSTLFPNGVRPTQLPLMG